MNARLTIAGGLLAVASWFLPGAGVAGATPPDPEPCVGVACSTVEPEAVVAGFAVGALTAGLVAGRALWGRR